MTADCKLALVSMATDQKLDELKAEAKHLAESTPMSYSEAVDEVCNIKTKGKPLNTIKNTLSDLRPVNVPRISNRTQRRMAAKIARRKNNGR